MKQHLSESCLFKGHVPAMARIWIGYPIPAAGDRRLMAGTVSSRRLLKAALGRRGSSIEGQLTGVAVDSRSRPVAAFQAPT